MLKVTGGSKHDGFKRFCNYCNKKQLSCQFCSVTPLKSSKMTGRFIYVCFDTDCTQEFEKHDWSFEHISNLKCAQQMCSQCEEEDGSGVD
jgi:predicted RNA-binding protein YlxR (DUF448 family)